MQAIMTSCCALFTVSYMAWKNDMSVVKSTPSGIDSTMLKVTPLSAPTSKPTAQRHNVQCEMLQAATRYQPCKVQPTTRHVCCITQNITAARPFTAQGATWRSCAGAAYSSAALFITRSIVGVAAAPGTHAHSSPAAMTKITALISTGSGEIRRLGPVSVLQRRSRTCATDVPRRRATP